MNKIKQSLFLKILLVFLTTGILIICALFIFDSYISASKERRAHRGENFVEYGHYLAKELDSNLSNDKVQQLAQRLSLKIRIQRGEQTILSNPEVSTFEQVETAPKYYRSPKGDSFGLYGDRLAIIAALSANNRYLFLLERDEQTFDDHPEWILEAGLLLLTILFLIYVPIRLILRPIVSLQKAVADISKGNLDVKIEHQSRDELGQLVKSFNQMTMQVRDMVKAREQLLLDVSHEFRSPLTRIKVAIELDDEESLPSIKRSANELESMVSEILESARMDNPRGELRFEVTSISDLLQDLVYSYHDLAPGIDLQMSKENISCEIDPLRFRMALQNLIDNALKYSAQQKRPVEVSLLKNGDLIQICVKDYGVGISEDQQQLIFEPFYRVDRSRVRSTGGYGLGLSLVKKIIAAHNAKIQVQSKDGWTLFIIELKAH